MSITKNVPLNWYSSMKKKLRKIRIIFDLENWLWKSEIGNFRSLDLERVLIYQNFFYEKVLFFTQLSYHLMCKLLKKSYMLSILYNLSPKSILETNKTSFDRYSLIQQSWSNFNLRSPDAYLLVLLCVWFMDCTTQNNSIRTFFQKSNQRSRMKQI